ncbi:MAG TPA: CvpA family protein [Terriglobales bacterium]|nr:CvpA family protein [Terriglobales bacterium]
MPDASCNFDSDRQGKNSVSGADWTIVVVIVASMLHAAWQGFFHTAFAIAGLVAGYLLAAWYYPRLAQWIAPHVKSPWVGDIVGFLTIFVGVVVLATVLGRAARWTMKQAGLRGFDRILGGILGLVRGGLMVAVLLVGVTALAPTAQWLHGSQLAPYFLIVGRAAIWVAPSELRARFYQGLDLLHEHRDPGTTFPQGKPTRH